MPVSLAPSSAGQSQPYSHQPQPKTDALASPPPPRPTLHLPRPACPPHPPTSPAGLLALLDEPDAQLQLFALEQLDSQVGVFWPEISERLVDMCVDPSPPSDPPFLSLALRCARWP